MPHDFHCKAIAKFLIPDQPQEDNYLDHDEFKEKEKEWEEKRDLVLAQHTAWVEREQVAEAKCAAEAAHAATEKQKLRREVVEHKQKTATRKKAGSIVDIVDREKLRAMLLINPTKSTLLPILNQGEVGPKKTEADLLNLVQQATDTSSIFSNQTFQPVT